MTTQYIHVRVQTKAKKERVEYKNKKYFIEVTEKPERGTANKRVKELVAKELHCTPACLRLIKGITTPSKIFLVINS